MIISVHPRAYDLQQARTDKGYAALFAYGWQQVDVRSSSEFVKILTSAVWSPAAIKDGHRRSASFGGARLLALDFETPEYSLAQATREWCDTVHWIGTTRNHQREKAGMVCDRFRLIVPWSETITDQEVYRYNYQVIGERYGADLSCKDACRLFFPCQNIASMQLDGEKQPVLTPTEEFLGRHERYANRLRTYGNARVLPIEIMRIIRTVIPTGQRNNVLWKLAKDLTRAGFSHDEIMRMVLASATYKDMAVSSNLLEEIRDTVKRAVNSVAAESL